MQHIGRAAASLLQHHRIVTTDAVQQIQRAQCAVLSELGSSPLVNQWQNSCNLQVQQLHSQSSCWHTPEAASCSSSSSSSWRQSPWHQLHCQPHGTRHNPAGLLPCSSSSSSCVTVQQLITYSTSAGPLTGETALQSPQEAAAKATPAAFASYKQQVPSSSSSPDSPPDPIVGICKRRNIKCGWKKIDYVLRMIRRATVDDAMAQLTANPKHAAVFVKHAVANARNNAIYAGGDPQKLWVAEAFVTRGKYTKRMHFMSRGFASIKETQYSHLNVRVEQMDDATAARVTLRRSPRLVAPLVQRMQTGTRRPRHMLARGTGSSGGRRQQQQLAQA